MPLPSDHPSAPALSASDALDAPAPTFARQRYDRGVELGRGGMGQVLSVRDAHLDRQVALKRVLHRGDDARLAREARITARLEHPSIVPVYSAGRDETGAIYYTMRLVRGRSLHDAIAAATTGDERLVLVRHVLDACRAVAYAHSMEVLHRDLKPANVMIGEYGETLVVDWGLARTFDEPDRGPVGTVGFASPEQTGGRSTIQSDVYGLGRILQAVIASGTDSPELAAIARRATQRNPTARYADAMALADELERWFAGRRVHAHAYTAAELLRRALRAWRVPLAITAVSALVLATTGWFAWHESEALLARTLVTQSQQAQARRAQPEAEILALAALERRPSPIARGVLASFSPDRPTLAHRVALPSCATVAVDGLSGRVLCGRADRLTIFAPDGSVAFERRANVRQATLTWGGRSIVGIAPANEHVLVLPERGPARDLDNGRGWFTVTTDPNHVILTSASQADVIDLQTGHRDRYDPCGATSLNGFSIDLRTRAWAAICYGDLVTGAGDDTPRTRTRVERRHRAEFPTRVLLVDDGAMVATSKGRLLHVTPERQREIASAGLGEIQSLQGSDHRLAAIGRAGGVSLVELKTGTVSFSLSSRDALAAALGPAGRLVAAGTERAALWQLPARSRPAGYTTGAGLASATLSPDGRHLAAARGDGKVDVFDLQLGRAVATLAWQEAVVKQAAFCPTGDRLVGVGMKHYGPVAYDTTAWADPEPLGEPGEQALRRVTCRSDGVVVALDYSGRLHAHGPDGHTIRALDSRALDLAASPRQTDLAVLHANGEVSVLGPDLAPRPLLRDREANEIALGPAHVAVALTRSARLYDRATGAPIRDLDVGDAEVLHLAFSPDGLRLAAALLDGTIHVFAVPTGELLGVLTGHEARVSWVEFGPTADTLVSASWDRTARLWDLTRLEAPLDTLLRQAHAAWGLELHDIVRHP